ncbi:MAG: sporulation initiation factor Spo0A C-terminal domain-containing protein [Anaerovoracaceae bacterium]|jgi:two-component system response regulator (stage 0 sporulation protein A)|nr:sporulation initiation factor Spo0A C-terminal domain-containing protein [Anaerovoracaceae bacterium]
MENETISDNHLQILIQKIVDEEGIRPDYKGFRYISEAVYMIVQDEELLDALTKEVYGEIARAHHTSIPSVERSIRFAINKLTKTPRYSGYSHPRLEVKTNKSFIANMANRVRYLDPKITTSKATRIQEKI